MPQKHFSTKGIVNLAQRPELKSDLITLLESGFPQGAPQTDQRKFEEEFSALLEPKNHSRILMLLEKEKPIATMSWKPYRLKNNLPLACVGLVTTHIDHQKKGHSRVLLDAVEKAARLDGASMLCLWSNLVDYYFKRGFVLAGSELSWELSPLKAPATKQNTNIAPITAGDIPKLVELYNSQPAGPLRQAIDFQRQLAQTHSLSLIATRDDKMAYAFAGKGRDLRNIVHELIGDFELYSDLLAAMQKKLPAQTAEFPMKLQFPYNHPQTLALENELGPADQGAVCFAKILDIFKVAEAINQELALQGLVDLKIVLPPTAAGDIQPWKLTHRKKSIFLSPDPGHLLQIFMSPWPLEDLEGLTKECLKALKTWSPYPLYFWGLDSV